MTIHTNWDNTTQRHTLVFKTELSDYQDLYMQPRIREIMKLTTELVDYIESETTPKGETP